jgi:hypothetical protein
MPEQMKIITSRRAYEFHADDLRLSMLSIKPVQDQIQQVFQFQASAMGTPFPTFGDVTATIPPGLVFNVGVWVSPDEQLVPIRFLNFEQYRIVIDVAGPSSAISGIFEHLQRFLAPLRSPDGSPLIGEPERIRDYSEIAAKYPFPLDAMFAQPLRKLFNSQTGVSSSKDLVLIPALAIQAFPSGQALPAVPGANTPNAFTFTMRSGTKPDDQIYFSAAPLDSEAHLIYLNKLEATLRS